MTIKLRCNDYGYECDLVLDEELTVGLIKKLRDHFEEEHGLDYTIEAVTQMITNRGHSLESIKKWLIFFSIFTNKIIFSHIVKINFNRCINFSNKL